jgi:hypothetical protein
MAKSRPSSYTNNWKFAEWFLCRKFVKDMPPGEKRKPENPELMSFQMFLLEGRKQRSLTFSRVDIGRTSNGKFLAAKGTREM